MSIKIITARNTEKNRSIEDDFVHIQFEKKTKKYITIKSNSVLFVRKYYKRIERFGRLMDISIILVAMVLWIQIHKNIKTNL